MMVSVLWVIEEKVGETLEAHQERKMIMMEQTGLLLRGICGKVK